MNERAVRGRGGGVILHCIRHAVTPSNLAGRFNDSEDESIHPSAVEVLKTLAVGDGAYDRVYVSPMRRCVETAEHLGLRDWTLEPRIAERGLGVFQGLTPNECQTLYGEPFDAFQRFEAEPAIPQGESRGAHLARVKDWLEEASRAGLDRVLAITHGGVIDFLYRLSGAHPVHGGERIFGGENLALSSFEVDWPRVRLLGFSETLDVRGGD
jgi:broad specificity phosphatase PhoE